METYQGNTGTTKRKVLIIGGGFAGLECALNLSNDNRFEVTLVDRTNHHLFQPLLYQVATASLTGPDIARSIRQILAKAKNVTVLMDEILGIDAVTRQATGKSGTIYGYDYLLLAAGARTGYFGNDHWAEHSLGLKSLADAQAIRRRVLTNLELAGAFADLVHRSLKSNFRRIDTSKLRIILIEGSGNILETYDLNQSVYARKHIEEIGVEVRTNTKVTNIRAGALEFADGTHLEAAAIIWAAGVAANPLTKSLGVPTDRGGRITPNPDLSVPGLPEVFVAGDLVAMRDNQDKVVPGVAPAASQMGRHIAKLLQEEARLEKGRFADRKHDLRPTFRYWDKGMMAIIGKNHAVVKAGKALRLQGFIAWLAWLFIHILFLIGFRNKLAVLLGWATAYIKNTPEARIIMHPPKEYEVTPS